MKITVRDTTGKVLTTFEAESKKTLLSQIEAQEVQIPNACHAGMCAACMCHIESGEEYIVKDFRTEPAFPLGNDEVMTCIGSVREGEGEIVLRTLY